MAIPLELIEPHPRLAFRFSYEIASLADSVRAIASETVPNGQLNPGRVVKRKDREELYYVYVGVRRFKALKSAYDATSDPRFAVFNACVDEGVSELDMFLIAKAENEDAKGERQGLSLLEEISALRKIRESIESTKLTGTVKRLFDLSQRIDDDKVKRLYDVERASHVRFRLSQLEDLCRVEGDEREFYTTAASVAGFGVEDVSAAAKGKEAAYHLDWFPKLFPDYKMEAERGREGVPNQPYPPNVETSRETEVHEEGVVVAACPWCEGGNIIRLEGEITLTHIPLDPDDEDMEAATAEPVCRTPFTCSHCRMKFCVSIRRLEEGGFAADGAKSFEFREPTKQVEALEVRFDRDKRAWVRIEGDRVTRERDLSPPGKRG